MNVYLRDDLIDWAGDDPFEAARVQQGSIYRDKEGRRTLRFEWRGRPYFLKLHQGVGWGEIAKNLLQGRLPVLGAENEYRAIRALETLGIDTLAAAGYGRRGGNPARQLSFLVTDELVGVESLEDFCGRWPQQPPAPAFKRQLIRRVAAIARLLHGAGINHRDFYLCHFLLQTDRPELSVAQRRLHVMDLHRAQIRARVPRRWLVKDLGALYYSALEIGLTARDILRFMREYRQRPLRELLTAERTFWEDVRARALQIYTRDHGRAPSSNTWIAMEKTLR